MIQRSQYYLCKHTKYPSWQRLGSQDENHGSSWTRELLKNESKPQSLSHFLFQIWSPPLVHMCIPSRVSYFCMLVLLLETTLGLFIYLYELKEEEYSNAMDLLVPSPCTKDYSISTALWSLSVLFLVLFLPVLPDPLGSLPAPPLPRHVCCPPQLYWLNWPQLPFSTRNHSIKQFGMTVAWEDPVRLQQLPSWLTL